MRTKVFTGQAFAGCCMLRLSVCNVAIDDASTHDPKSSRCRHGFIPVWARFALQATLQLLTPEALYGGGGNCWEESRYRFGALSKYGLCKFVRMTTGKTTVEVDIRIGCTCRIRLVLRQLQFGLRFGRSTRRTWARGSSIPCSRKPN
jgi:hypothetical protein